MGPGLVLMSAMLWATVGVATGLMPEGSRWPPEVLALSRLALAGPILLLVALAQCRDAARALALLDRRALVTFAVGAAVFQISLFHAFALIGAAAAVFVSVGLKPVFGAIWTRISGGAALSRREALGAVLGVIGLCLLSIEEIGTPEGASWLAGVALAATGAAAFVAMAFSVSRLSEASPVLVSGAGLSLAAVVILGVIGIASAGGLIDLGPIRIDRPSVSLAVYLAVFPTAVAYIAFSLGMRHCSSIFAGLTAAMVEPAIAAMLACWLLAETFSLLQAAGGATLMAVAALSVTGGKPGEASVQKQQSPLPRITVPKGIAQV